MFVHLQTVFYERGVHYVFNHIDIEIKYLDGSGEDWDGPRLISAKVTPRRYDNLFRPKSRGDSFTFVYSFM